MELQACARPTLGLPQQHVENAKTANMISTSSLASSSAFLSRAPNHVNMSLLHGHQLWILGLTNEAIAFHEQLISRNPALLAARAFLLQQYDARAVCAGMRQTLQSVAPGKPDAADFERMRLSGRWSLASYGPDETAPAPVTPERARENPLTHRAVRNGKKESHDEYRTRVDRSLRECAETLPTNFPHALIYPNGDFGQASLDVSPDEIAVLQDIARRANI